MTDAERKQQRAAGLRLLGRLVRFNHQPNGPFHLCTLLDRDGMVEVFDMTGRFAPHLFVVVPDLTTSASAGDQTREANPDASEAPPARPYEQT